MFENVKQLEGILKVKVGKMLGRPEGFECL
jgi:hypothetical protein